MTENLTTRLNAVKESASTDSAALSVLLTDIYNRQSVINDTVLGLSSILTNILSLQSDVANALITTNSALGSVVDRLDTAQSVNGSANALLTDIRNAIGAITTYPTNYTVRRLLAMLQESLDSPPPPVVSEGDLPLCAGGALSSWVQCTGYNSLGNQSYNGTTYSVFSPIFGSTMEQYSLIGSRNLANGRNVYRHLGTSIGDVTIAYKFVLETAPSFIVTSERTWLGTTDDWNDVDIDNPIYASFNPASEGCYSVQTTGIETSVISGGDLIVEYFVLFGTGISGNPPTNLFLASAFAGS